MIILIEIVSKCTQRLYCNIEIVLTIQSFKQVDCQKCFMYRSASHRYQ